MEWIWLGVIISLILVELLSLNFIAIWFAISSVISLILLKLEKDYIVQVLSFLIVGLIFIIIIRPRIINTLRNNRDKIINKILDKYPLFIKLIPKELKEKYTVKRKLSTSNLKKKNNNQKNNKKNKRK